MKTILLLIALSPLLGFLVLFSALMSKAELNPMLTNLIPVTYFLALVIYLYIVLTNKKLSSKDKISWTIGFLFLGFIEFPYYWLKKLK